MGGGHVAKTKGKYIVNTQVQLSQSKIKKYLGTRAGKRGMAWRPENKLTSGVSAELCVGCPMTFCVCGSMNLDEVDMHKHGSWWCIFVCTNGVILIGWQYSAYGNSIPHSAWIAITYVDLRQESQEGYWQVGWCQRECSTVYSVFNFYSTMNSSISIC